VLLHDCGKAVTRSVDQEGRVRFLDHEAAGARLAAGRASALRLSADEATLVRMVVANHMRPNQFARDPESMTPRALHRLMRQTGACAPDLALLGVCDCLGRAREAFIAGCDRSVQVGERIISLYFSRYDAAVAPAPLLGGADVLDMGLRPGPAVGRVLEAVREAQMVGEIHTEADARALARRLISELA
jgi:poly(A) polymerase